MTGSDATRAADRPGAVERRQPPGPAPVVFEAVEGGLAAVDLGERHRYTLSTAPDVTPRRADTDAFVYPVDAAVRVATDQVATPGDVPAVYVRDADWTMLAATDPPTERTFPAGEYYLEICAPVKLFVHVEGSLTVTATTAGKTVDFGGERTVEVGAFSKATRPTATVTTTEDPRDVMAAVSTFGAALKTTSPERSFPNQRGHPPAVELGDELSIPEGLAPPDTGVTIEVPPELRYVYPVATLAHYLGATVVPGERPRLVTDAGYVHDLAPGGEFERELERVLKGTFLLDCVARTEGLYDVALAERRALEPDVDLAFDALYDAPLAERLAAYLDVPYGTLAPHVPAWKLTADVAATPDAAETLPFVVDDLAVVRTDAGREPSRAGADARRDTSRAGTDAGGVAAAAVDSFLRSSREVGAAPTPATTDLPTADSLERTWVGDGTRSGASKAMAAAYRNGMDRAGGDGEVGVTVVCNDPAMVDEHTAVDEVYGGADAAPIDVSVLEGLTAEELRVVLETDTEFLHYIGHIDERGFECRDGWLDAATLEDTGVDTFLLNACSSYEQGMALIEAGAVGGIVTLAKVLNGTAVPIGSTVARLLDGGYPLRPALDIARTTCYSSEDYIVVGDGSATAVAGGDYFPNLYRLDRDGDGYRLEIISYASATGGMGDIIIPYLADADQYYLAAGSLDVFRVTASELESFLALDKKPVIVDGDLYWSDTLSVDDI